MAQQIVPAWKRLGLKLKYANENIDASVHHHDTKTNGVHNGAVREDGQPGQLEPPKKKRKTEDMTESEPVSATRRTNGSSQISPPREIAGTLKAKKLKKKVSFSNDTKALDETSPEDPDRTDESPAQEKPKKKTKTKTDSQKLQNNGKPHAALEYLIQYHEDRRSWKFNKNRETWILKHVLSESDIPRDYDLALGRYISGLQSVGARDRLRKECLEHMNSEKNDSSEGGEVHRKVAAERDEKFRQRFWEFVQQSDGQSPEEGEISEKELKVWLSNQTRSHILRWSLDGPDSTKTQPPQKKKKNRTAVVEYDSSSSSSSSSEDDSESTDSTTSDSESESEDAGSDATSSSGDSSSDADSGTDSGSD